MFLLHNIVVFTYPLPENKKPMTVEDRKKVSLYTLSSCILSTSYPFLPLNIILSLFPFSWFRLFPHLKHIFRYMNWHIYTLICVMNALQILYSFQIFIILIMSMYFCVCMYVIWIHIFLDTRRAYQSFWSWSYKWSCSMWCVWDLCKRSQYC